MAYCDGAWSVSLCRVLEAPEDWIAVLLLFVLCCDELRRWLVDAFPWLELCSFSVEAFDFWWPVPLDMTVLLVPSLLFDYCDLCTTPSELFYY